MLSQFLSSALGFLATKPLKIQSVCLEPPSDILKPEVKSASTAFHLKEGRGTQEGKQIVTTAQRTRWGQSQSGNWPQGASPGADPRVQEEGALLPFTALPANSSKRSLGLSAPSFFNSFQVPTIKGLVC